MLILPDIPKSSWRTPSQAQPKDCFGNENVTRFRLIGRLSDGFVRWRGWFDDRDDADAFLYAMISGSLISERELWRLPTPAWHPDFGENLVYEFATVTFLTTTGSNQTFTLPVDWNNASNTIETLGAGGSGSGQINDTAAHNTGGGGGAYNSITNQTLSANATYQIGAGGASVTTQVAGNPGTADTWFCTTSGNCASIAGTAVVVGSKAGNGGITGTGSRQGGEGGLAASGIGAGFDGGDGGDLTGASGSGVSGGGGAAGASGAGVNGVDNATTSTGINTAGGAGNAGTGGGGTGGASASADPATATAGGGGTNFDATHGSGGGGGGGWSTGTGLGTGGSGGLYGAGGGAARSRGGGTISSGAGRQGLIVVTYTPAVGRHRMFLVF